MPPSPPADPECVFCDLEHLRGAEGYFENGRCAYASTRDPRDLADVVPGSGIVVPIAHRASPFDLTEDEWVATGELLVRAKAAWEERLAPDGYFLSWSSFPACAADVAHMHAHLHVVPRFDDEPLAHAGGRSSIKVAANRRADPSRPGSGRACGFGPH